MQFRLFLENLNLKEFSSFVDAWLASGARDNTQLLVIADWLEERGDELATLIRHIVNPKNPHESGSKEYSIQIARSEYDLHIRNLLDETRKRKFGLYPVATGTGYFVKPIYERFAAQHGYYVAMYLVGGGLFGWSKDREHWYVKQARKYQPCSSSWVPDDAKVAMFAYLMYRKGLDSITYHGP